MLKLYLAHVPYWLFCGVVGVAMGLLVFAGITRAAGPGSETIAYMSAFVAIKITLDEARRLFFAR